eukprot:CAMPEP_0113965756 /NCGR_PEP_ID=MMETSP0011_2-20120614/7931_1 /TAXON_ID=101924 /ORGANISM="Rhodosorus marinus" /LENGTH=195 /DNA_ID=CAMNT_0000978323 /DNA_START=22 /DNA_END=609 /DNA_ORIENTATION=+ /assembly_acc=CAM_ASM_000156
MVTEIGDKTFFMSVVMAMRHSKVFVLLGSLSALILMTLLSTLAGRFIPTVLDPSYTTALAFGLFTFFGVHMMLEWWNSPVGQGAVFEETKKELKSQDTESSTQRLGNLMIWMRCFWITFLAEWGDRSQLTTVTLAASRNAYGIALGGILGQTLCTTVAVLGGAFLAARISERMVSLVGGLFFLASGSVIGLTMLV